MLLRSRIFDKKSMGEIMNLILCDDDKVFLNKLEIRIRGLSQKHKIAVKMECYVSAKEMLEGIKNLDEISVFFIDM